MEELWEGFETAKRLPCVGLLGLLCAPSLARGVWEVSNIYCYGNGPYGNAKYRISSVPPLNSCIDRLCGIRDDVCVSGGVTDCFCVHAMVVKREIAIIPSSFRNRSLPVG